MVCADGYADYLGSCEECAPVRWNVIFLILFILLFAVYATFQWVRPVFRHDFDAANIKPVGFQMSILQDHLVHHSFASSQSIAIREVE